MRILAVAVLLAACTPPANRETEARLSRLEDDVRLLREDNLRLRERVIDLETARTTPLPQSSPSKPILARCRESGGRWMVTQAEADEILENMAGLAMEMRIVPSFENGKARGFKLFAIRPGSLAASCGLENGDVITRMNGMEVSSPDKALEAYTKIKNDGRVDLAIERKGAKTSVVIETR